MSSAMIDLIGQTVRLKPSYADWYKKLGYPSYLNGNPIKVIEVDLRANPPCARCEWEQEPYNEKHVHRAWIPLEYIERVA